MDMTIVIFLCIIGAAKWSAMPKVNNTRLANRIELPERAKSDMATPKIKTLQTRFGFADTDLKNPVHDDIIKWLDDNIEDVLATVFKSSRPEGVRGKWEPLVRMSEEGGQFIGFADLAAYQVNHDGFVLFEAKTKIDSLGELFRQL